MSRWLWLCLLCVAAVWIATPAGGAPGSAPRTHTVARGQRLGSIAKRYHVTIEALCSANSISRRDPIHPGQLLVIPADGDPDGTRTAGGRQRRQAQSRGEAEPRPDRRSQPRSTASGASPHPSAAPRVYQVRRGDTLGKIAKRNRVTIAALCHASGVSRRDPLRPGQQLIIPSPDDVDGSTASRSRMAGKFLSGSADGRPKRPNAASKPTSARRQAQSPSWAPYVAPPWRRGYVTLVGFHESWKGYVIGPGGRLLPAARQAISRVLGATDDRPRVHPRLARLLATVSDTFGGRAIRVVSGYRERSFSAHSRHRLSQAIDFSIPGVPNAVLRDYLRTLGSVGVGYYPNSTFVHFDVRDQPTYWLDYSGPGETPQYAGAGRADDDGPNHSSQPPKTVAGGSPPEASD